MRYLPLILFVGCNAPQAAQPPAVAPPAKQHAAPRLPADSIHVGELHNKIRDGAKDERTPYEWAGRVTGKVSAIRGRAGQWHVILSDLRRGIFSEAACPLADVSALSVGQTVTVIGRCRPHLLSVVAYGVELEPGATVAD